MRSPRCVMVTGGAGFIGSNLVRFLLTRTEFTGRVVNVDKLTYAGHPANLAVEDPGGRHVALRADICDPDAMTATLRAHEVDTIIHLAAETHVDRSIRDPGVFARTNVLGTCSLLDSARAVWGDRVDVRLHHVSTDEVFGPAAPGTRFDESSPYAPCNPYAASKAASDHFVRAAWLTYGLPASVSYCTNNYGPRQNPEKLIPRMIVAMLEGEPLPVYGAGTQVRDWLYVEDHCAALWATVTAGRPGGRYLLAGGNEWRNIDLVRRLCAEVARQTGRPEEDLERLVTHVADRPAHDARYALDGRRTESELGWKPAVTFDTGLEATVRWYVEHRGWIDGARRGG